MVSDFWGILSVFMIISSDMRRIWPTPFGETEENYEYSVGIASHTAYSVFRVTTTLTCYVQSHNTLKKTYGLLRRVVW